MHKLLPILHVLSKLIMLFAGLYVVPAVVSIIYQDGTLDEFLVSMFVGMALGLLLWAVTRRYEAELKPRDGFMLVSFLFGTIDALKGAGLADWMPTQLTHLPLSEQGLAWLVPCVMTLVVAVVCDRLLGKRSEAVA